jgi:hypothetical protein
LSVMTYTHSIKRSNEKPYLVKLTKSTLLMAQLCNYGPILSSLLYEITTFE